MSGKAVKVVRVQKAVKPPPGASKKLKPPKFYDETLFRTIATMMLGGKSVSDIKNVLQKHDPGYRETLTTAKGISSPDSECKSASEKANEFDKKKAPAYSYKHLAQRDNIFGLPRYYPTTGSPWANAMVIKRDSNNQPLFKNDRNGKVIPVKERRRVDLSDDREIWQGRCGLCWMCGLMVYYYVTNNNVTGCGECEHIGGIVASFLAGMLAASMQFIQIHNYGTAHAHCNQQKSDTLSMKFDGRKWIVDKAGINNIINHIINGIIPYNSTPNGNEYDPEFLREYKKKTTNPERLKQWQDEMRARIRDTTQEWCDAANLQLGPNIPGYTLSAKKLIQIMQWTTKLGTKVKGGAAFDTKDDFEYVEVDDEEDYFEEEVVDDFEDREEDYLNYSGYLDKGSEIFDSINTWLESNKEPKIEDKYKINVCRILKKGKELDADNYIVGIIDSYFQAMYKKLDVVIRDILLTNLNEAIDQQIGPENKGLYLDYIETSEKKEKEATEGKTEEAGEVQEKAGEVQEKAGEVQEKAGEVQEEADKSQEEADEVQEEADRLQKIKKVSQPPPSRRHNTLTPLQLPVTLSSVRQGGKKIYTKRKRNKKISKNKRRYIRKTHKYKKNS